MFDSRRRPAAGTACHVCIVGAGCALGHSALLFVKSPPRLADCCTLLSDSQCLAGCGTCDGITGKCLTCKAGYGVIKSGFRGLNNTCTKVRWEPATHCSLQQGTRGRSVCEVPCRPCACWPPLLLVRPRHLSGLAHLPLSTMLQCKDPSCEDCSGNPAVCRKCVSPGYGLVAGACRKVSRIHACRLCRWLLSGWAGVPGCRLPGLLTGMLYHGSGSQC